VRHATPFAGSASKQNLWGGRGAACPPQEEARPPYNYRFSGKIWCGQILPLCSKKEQKIHKI